MNLKYVYDRLRPFKLESTDPAPLSGDICRVPADTIDSAGLTEKDLKSLPEGVYYGMEETLNKHDKMESTGYVFSKAALGSLIKGEISHGREERQR